MATGRDPLQECGALSHRAVSLMRTRMRIFRDPRLIGLEGLPVDEARMMIADKNCPFGKRQPASPFAHLSELVDIALIRDFP